MHLKNKFQKHLKKEQGKPTRNADSAHFPASSPVLPLLRLLSSVLSALGAGVTQTSVPSGQGSFMGLWLMSSFPFPKRKSHEAPQGTPGLLTLPAPRELLTSLRPGVTGTPLCWLGPGPEEPEPAGGRVPQCHCVGSRTVSWWRLLSWTQALCRFTCLWSKEKTSIPSPSFRIKHPKEAV